MNVLDQLAIKYGTDKGSWHHDYTRFYERLMGCEREIVTEILEIGVGTGASARMWLDYFPNALVYVVDIEPKAIKHLTDAAYPGRDRLRTILSYQSTILWNAPYMPMFDYIIDDGSHFPLDQIKTFEAGFHKVKPGGLWIIEDTHCNFHPLFNSKGVDLYGWLHNIINAQQTIGYDGSGNFYGARKKGDPEHANHLMWQIYSITSYRSCIIFEKAEA